MHHRDGEEVGRANEGEASSSSPWISRRRAMACLAWAGAGILWTLDGGVPRGVSLGGWAASAAETASSDVLSFVQISDSHIGFNKAPNPDPAATLASAIERIRNDARRPAFMLHTGDVSHLSRPEEFDIAQQIVNGAGLETRYVPGEHDVIGDDGRAFFSRFSPDTQGKGWYSFDQRGVHFVALVNVLGLKAGGMGYLGDTQLAWLAADLKGRSHSTPVVVFTHMPLWSVYPAWGWGTDDGERALALLRPFGSVTVLNGHIHQVLQKVEGNVRLQTAMSTAFPQPAPGEGPGPGPLKVETSQLRQTLGIRRVEFTSLDGAPLLGDATLVS
ncbi:MULTISPECIES: metallophosphoesterase [Pandoraea]|uniref:metallophosphoesterase family protein n=1 Tax=Pandoraea TaxID=93217 RepID=UPI001F5E17D4|nr:MULTISPECIES: metallophosphoesterase [Pandoraea]MCI3207820.1 metallophosphoesterase [Pandoraea sp. LA3]MDN4585849.1 metallophosphoesterase [Pandoraea capi]